jgi:hypothetical protein
MMLSVGRNPSFHLVAALMGGQRSSFSGLIVRVHKPGGGTLSRQ